MERLLAEVQTTNEVVKEKRSPDCVNLPIHSRSSAAMVVPFSVDIKKQVSNGDGGE